MRKHCLVFLALGGCLTRSAAITLVPTTEAPHTLVPRAPGDIKVVSTPPGEPFAEIGLVEGVPNDVGTNVIGPEEVLSRMREAAGRWGCDYLLISSSTISKNARDQEGYGGVGYHGACLVLLDAAKSASFAKGPPVPLKSDAVDFSTPYEAQSAPISGSPETTSPPTSPVQSRAILFRTAEGKVYSVKPESREEALHAGWVPIGTQ